MPDDDQGPGPKIEASIHDGEMSESRHLTVTVRGRHDDELGHVQDVFEDEVDRLLEKVGTLDGDADAGR